MVKVFNRITDIRNSRPPFPLLLIKCTLFPAMVYWDHLHLLLFSLRHGDKISPLAVWLKSSWQSGCVWWLWLGACCMHALVSHGGDRKDHVRTTRGAQDQLHFPLQGQGQELQTWLLEINTPEPSSERWNKWLGLTAWSLCWCKKGMAKPARTPSALLAKPAPKVPFRFF